MGWCVLAQVFAILVDLLAMGRRSADEKDLEIVLLRLSWPFTPSSLIVWQSLRESARISPWME
jgi:hypothetical protein